MAYTIELIDIICSQPKDAGVRKMKKNIFIAIAMILMSGRCSLRARCRCSRRKHAPYAMLTTFSRATALTMPILVRA